MALFGRRFDGSRASLEAIELQVGDGLLRGLSRLCDSLFQPLNSGGSLLLVASDELNAGCRGSGRSLEARDGVGGGFEEAAVVVHTRGEGFKPGGCGTFADLDGSEDGGDVVLLQWGAPGARSKPVCGPAWSVVAWPLVVASVLEQLAV